MHRFRIRLPLLACLLLSVMANLHAAVYSGKQVTYHQPDGSTFEVRLWGDEFSVNTETLDGWAVIRDANRWWTYAQPDGNGGIGPSAVKVGLGDPTALQVAKHLRLSRTQITTTRKTMQARLQKNRMQAGMQAGPLPAPPTATTVGTRNGVTIMVSFPDRAGDVTITHAQVDAFCNGNAYTGFGNNGSVKSYFNDVSNGTLTYTNSVYGTYVVAAQNRSYYADTSVAFGERVEELVAQALSALDTAGFNFNACDVNADGNIDAVNIFYAGVCPNDWAEGLWPHMNPGFSWTSTGGKRARGYQITDMTNQLTLGTFCHENGHLLCGFPDLYDYDYDSTGGAGRFCLMASGASGTTQEKNPARVSGYLSLKAGWRTPTDLTSASTGTLSLTAGTAGIYRFVKSGTPTEYFLIECRYKAARDLLLPASGIAIWHIDELGDRDDQRYTDNTAHRNFECALVQADNRRDFENDANQGDAYDLWYLGNTRSTGIFADSVPYSNTANDARWWDGSASDLGLINFSAAGPSMTVDIYGQSIAVTNTAVTVAEGDSGTTSVSITLRRSGKVSGIASVDWQLVDGTATAAGLDFTGASGTVTWSSGQSGNKTVRVNVRGDTRDEANETFTLQISAPVPGTISLGATTSTITITDDDAAPGTAGSFEFTPNLVSVTEGVATVQLTVKRLARSAAVAVDVPWTLSGGTATIVDDFNAAAGGTLSWGATDDADKTISIDVLEDTLTEANETIVVQLGTASDPLATVPFPDTSTLTIVDDDGSVALLGTAAGAQEPATAPDLAQIPLQRIGALSGAISVQYRTIGGTAIDGIDYTAVTAGTVDWLAGDGDNKYAVIQILPDSATDGDKTVRIELFNPVGCTISGPTIVTLTLYEVSAASRRYQQTASSSGIDGGCGAGGVGLIIGLGVVPLLLRRRRR